MNRPSYDNPPDIHGPLWRQPARRPRWAERKEAAKTFMYAVLSVLAIIVLAGIGVVAVLVLHAAG